MPTGIGTQMLDALELFYYAYRFRSSLFIIAISGEQDLERLMTDLRVLRSSGIKTLIVSNSSSTLSSFISTWNSRGTRFKYIESGEEEFSQVSMSLAEDEVPLVESGGQKELLGFEKHVFEYAEHFGAAKIFFLTAKAGLEIDGKLVSHLDDQELAATLSESHKLNFDAEFLKLLATEQQRLALDIILLQSVPGSIFEEVFTHRGIGTMITREYPNLLRQAELSDVAQLSLIARPYIRSGVMLPVSEDEISEQIASYLVYEVNKEIVASAMLKYFGSYAELARVGTLPRYQGRGRARDLCVALIDKARSGGSHKIFSVSTESHMWDFFQSLGMKEISRRELPEEWQRSYDLARPSKAFSLSLAPK